MVNRGCGDNLCKSRWKGLIVSVVTVSVRDGGNGQCWVWSPFL